MDSDLRTLLQEKAEEARIAPRIPTAVLRRSRRRRVANAVLAGMVTAAVVASATLVTRAILAERGQPRLGPGVAPDISAHELYPFVYPPTREELETTQEQVAQGSMPMWTDPRGAAHLYAVNVLGWKPEDVAVDVRGDEPIAAVITNPTLTAAVGAEGDLRTTLHLVEVPGGRPPIYAVLAAESEVIQLEPVGPDDQPFTGTTVAFRGQPSVVPEGGAVILSVGGIRAHPWSPPRAVDSSSRRTSPPV